MRKLTQADVIARFKATHGNKYDYSHVEYSGNKVAVEIVCPEHGVFTQAPEKHAAGNECPTCGRAKASAAKRLGTQRFIEKARAVHGEKYDYSKVEYGNDNEVSVEIVCPEHGAFRQQPHNHLSGKGCKKCADIRTAEAQIHTASEFITAARLIHGDTYDYSEVEYIQQHVDVGIICQKHGKFWQRPGNHLYNEAGCPSCTSNGTSRMEQALFEFILSICPDAINGDRKTLNGREIDILVPSLGIGIELNGIYHHSELFNKDIWYHQKKLDDAAAVGIRLIHIWSDEWLEKPEVIKGYLRRQLGCPTMKIGARQCKLVKTTGAEQREFLEANHLQGFSAGSGFALTYGDEVVACAIFKVRGRGGNELVRWCVRMDTDVIGGFSRVMKQVSGQVISYCDLAKHTGEGYLKTGWEIVNRKEVPQTFFVQGKRRLPWQTGASIAGGFSKAHIEAAGLLRLNGCRQLKLVRRAGIEPTTVSLEG